jgi:hypothetical protein
MGENLMERNYEMSDRQGRGLWIGVGLIILGAVFLLDRMGIHLAWFHINWWALFILIPGGIILKNVYDAYEANGQTLTRTTRTQLLIGLLMVLFAFSSLAGIGMHIVMPILLIVGGAAILASVANR